MRDSLYICNWCIRVVGVPGGTPLLTCLFSMGDNHDVTELHTRLGKIIKNKICWDILVLMEFPDATCDRCDRCSMCDKCNNYD